jgi:RNA polymerase sigma factor (sigma-70 family)
LDQTIELGWLELMNEPLDERLAGRDVALVVRARSGAQDALDELVAGSLRVVYNLVGRALDGHPDVDDVVLATMLGVLHDLPRLRDPASFHPWLLATAVRRVREHLEAATADPETANRQANAFGVAHPGADFVDLTITELGLTRQRRELAEATRWLDEDDRDVLAVWWLSAGGQVSKRELADALGMTTRYAAVRVQRMKAQLTAGRVVVRALWATPRCPELLAVLGDWTGRPGPVWRKQFARHTRECERCGKHWLELMAPDRLLIGVRLLPVPPAIPRALLAASLPTADAAGATGPAKQKGSRRHRATKPIVMLAASTLVAGAVAGVAYARHAPPTDSVAAPDPTTSAGPNGALGGPGWVTTPHAIAPMTTSPHEDTASAAGAQAPSTPAHHDAPFTRRPTDAAPPVQQPPTEPAGTPQASIAGGQHAFGSAAGHPPYAPHSSTGNIVPNNSRPNSQLPRSIGVAAWPGSADSRGQARLPHPDRKWDWFGDTSAAPTPTTQAPTLTPTPSPTPSPTPTVTPTPAQDPSDPDGSTVDSTEQNSAGQTSAQHHTTDAWPTVDQ